MKETNGEKKMKFEEKNKMWVAELTSKITKIQAEINKYDEAFAHSLHHYPIALEQVNTWKNEIKTLKSERSQWKKFC